MDKEDEIQDLKEKLRSINSKIREELTKIDQLKLKITTVYRRRDKKKYEDERKQITANLTKYETEMDLIKKRLSELESRGIPS